MTVIPPTVVSFVSFRSAPTKFGSPITCSDFWSRTCAAHVSSVRAWLLMQLLFRKKKATPFLSVVSLFYRVLCFLCNSEAFWHTLTRVHTHPLARQWYVGHLNNTVGPLPGHQTHDTPPHSLTTKTGKKSSGARHCSITTVFPPSS